MELTALKKEPFKLLTMMPMMLGMFINMGGFFFCEVSGVIHSFCYSLAHISAKNLSCELECTSL